jgi:UDP-N-acetyl-D-glucosamine dehydrogenase
MQTIVVHGGGYVGLTGAIHAALSGYKVIIYDPDTNVVNAINNGKPRANEYLSYIDANVGVLVKSNMLHATNDYESIQSELYHLLAVPTESGDTPNMSIVKKCITNLHTTVPDSGLIIVESTLQPKTIDSLYIPRVYSNKIGLAVCPRLDWFGDKNKNVGNLPRIVGGVTPESTEKAAWVLGKFCTNTHKTNHRVAEWAKCGQNALYFVQIMAAHEMAKTFHSDVNFNEALKFIGLHWRLPELFLGPGTSGRCVQMGAQYINNIDSKRYMPILEASLHQDFAWRKLIGDVLTKGVSPKCSIESKKLLVMGIAYRANFSDFGYSAGLDIAKNLKEEDWNISINDPIIHHGILNKLMPVSTLNDSFDGVLLATGHDAYSQLPDNMINFKKGCFVLDACGLWEKYRESFRENDVIYCRVGDQGWIDLL